MLNIVVLGSSGFVKILILLGLVIAVIVVFRNVANKSSSKPPDNPPENSKTSSTSQQNLVKDIKVLIDYRGGRMDWSWENDLIAYSIFREEGNYGGEIYTMKPDGGEKKCLTCDVPQLAHLSNDQPNWHPSGNYIIFQSIDPNLTLPPQYKSQEKRFTQGGFGFNNNLWLTDKDGKNFYQLTKIKDREASMHAHFSSDGKKLLWSARIVDGRGGRWVLRTADFVDEQGNSRLENIKDYSPLGSKFFYEAHDFFPGDKSIIFSSSANPDKSTTECATCALSLWRLDLASGNVTALTESKNTWNEHAHLTSDGRKIDWISSQGYPFNPTEDWTQDLKTDLWIMDADGSNKQQLTFFNTPGHKEYTGDRIIIADSAWNKAGNKIVATQSSIKGRVPATKIIVVELNNP